MGSRTFRELAVEQVLRYSAVLHSANVAEPAETALAGESENGWQTRLFEYVGVGDPVLPFDPQDAPKTAEMKGV